MNPWQTNEKHRTNGAPMHFKNAETASMSIARPKQDQCDASREFNEDPTNFRKSHKTWKHNV